MPSPGERERIRTRSQQVARIVGCHVIVHDHPGALCVLLECIEPVGTEDAGAFGGDAARIRGKQVPSPVEIEGELVERFLRDNVTHGINIANTGLVFEAFIKEAHNILCHLTLTRTTNTGFC